MDFKSLKRQSQNTVKLMVLMVGLSAIGLSGCGGAENQAAGPQQGAPGAAQAARVTTTTVSSQSVGIKVELQGRTRPYAISEVRPQVTGLIEKRLFEEGQDVKEGDALYQIEDSEYRAAVQSAEASLARAKANAEIAAETADRLKGLADINAVSRQNAHEAMATAKQAKADVSMQRAALEQARIDLERTTIKAPIDGTIGRSTVTPGALVTQNQAQELATIRRLDPLYVDLTVSADDLLKWKRRIANGSLKMTDGEIPITIYPSDGEVYEHEGRLAFSEVSVDETAGTVVLRAIVPNPEGWLLPGMFVRAQLEVGEVDGAVLVPQAAVMRTPTGKAYALVVNGEGMAEERLLEVSQAQGTDWVVTGGMDDGDEVIVTGLQGVRAGMPVAVANTPDNGAANSAALSSRAAL